MRSGVGIFSGHKVRPVGEESSNFRRRALDREVGGIENGKRRTAHHGHDSVDLPVAECMLIPAMRLSPERQTPLVAENKAVTGIEQGATALGSEIEGILCQIILTCHRLGR